MNLLSAFEEAKRRSLARALDFNAPRLPVPFAPAHADAMRERFGADPWPYGIEPNRPTLDWFLERAAEQGVCERRLEVDELFVPEVRERHRV
jgi:4,5-dihydroxyphthalate decarboxylase